MQRPVVGNDAHASEAKAVQGLPIALEAGPRVILERLVRLQEAVELVARLKPEEMAQLGVGQAAGLVFGEAERLQGAARNVAGFAQPGGELVGDRQGAMVTSVAAIIYSCVIENGVVKLMKSLAVWVPIPVNVADPAGVTVVKSPFPAS